MATILDKILAHKHLELAHRRRQVPLGDMQKRAVDVAQPQGTLTRLFRDGAINIIAEMKRASPSAGVLRPKYSPEDLAREYEEAGAKALSVLTDAHYFQGSLDDIQKAAAVCKLPILRKDFTTDEYHLHEARVAGATGVLLIVAALDDFQIRDYLALATELGLSTLVEIHNQNEWARVSTLPIKILGINNRDLKSLITDIAVTENLLPEITSGPSAAADPLQIISESGLSYASDLQRLAGLGVSGFLIGESLLREASPGNKLKELIGA